MAEHMGLGDLGVEGVMGAASALSAPAESYINQPELEMEWAMKAYEHAETYFNLLCAVDPKLLRLTPHDDDVYTKLRETFPDLNVGRLQEDELKSAEAKEKWRPFCNYYEDKIQDFNFGTLLRLDSTSDYSEKNSILVTRIQFFAVEIARNREGYNSKIRELFKPTPKTKS
ncbi:PREDICTED: protein PBDC1-like [Priapulus caudatus]|uniref:Protein PBDC1-like n=1 Tax=Priapulus caudatus TaxID=37621 RepID=A0ABM1E8M6_PRICU|nr:PREDICTED: protein PBDC1-like [Priapulus caudatus]